MIVIPQELADSANQDSYPEEIAVNDFPSHHCSSAFFFHEDIARIE